ncbi:MAG: FlgD immunoglobulin-like domain containing protein, partial [Bacteroidota bacterium]
NPFNPTTTIPVAIPRESRIRLEVYNVLGQLVATLHDGNISPGRHFFAWDGKNTQGATLSSGVYFSRLSVNGGVTLVGKMNLIK